jgi:hypothetical protein
MPKPHKLIKCGPGGKKCHCCCPPPGDRARRYLFKQAQRNDEKMALEEGVQEFELEEIDWPKVESPTFTAKVV